MPSRPSDPTSALAALIAGNHRHVERRTSSPAEAVRADESSSHPFPRHPFAIALVEPSPLAVTPRIFAAGHDDVVLVDSIEDLVGKSHQLGIKLIVAIHPIQSELAQVSSVWQHAEVRAFAMVETILRESVHLRGAAAAGELRVVAALLEDSNERIHWIGEHPEIDLLVRDR